MKKKNDLIFIIVFIFVVGISLLYLFQASYAKYRKQITGNLDATIAHWNVKVNNEECRMRGKKIYRGDKVLYDDKEVNVI